MNRMRKVFLEAAQDFVSSTKPVSRHPDVQSASPTLSAHLIRPEISRLHSRPLPSATHPPAHCRTLQVSRIPRKLTETVQVSKLFRKAHIPTSHDPAPGSDPLPPTESQPKFASDAIDGEITTDSNRKKQRVGSFSASGTTNTRLEQGSYDDVFRGQPPVGQEYRMFLIGKSVKAALASLQIVLGFSRNPSSRGGDPSFSLVEQLYAAHIPVSHQSHIFFSSDHLIAIQETNWILALFNITKERGDLSLKA